MTVSFDLPVHVEQRLRQAFDDINAGTKEAALVELYRQDHLTLLELSQALGLTRLETEAILKKHHVTEDLPSSEEVIESISELRRLLAK